jgi:hypothetical protein
VAGPVRTSLWTAVGAGSRGGQPRTSSRSSKARSLPASLKNPRSTPPPKVSAWRRPTLRASRAPWTSTAKQSPPSRKTIHGSRPPSSRSAPVSRTVEAERTPGMARRRSTSSRWTAPSPRRNAWEKTASAESTADKGMRAASSMRSTSPTPSARKARRPASPMTATKRFPGGCSEGPGRSQPARSSTGQGAPRKQPVPRTAGGAPGIGVTATGPWNTPSNRSPGTAISAFPTRTIPRQSERDMAVAISRRAPRRRRA